jgi:hypothetical protein
MERLATENPHVAMVQSARPRLRPSKPKASVTSPHCNCAIAGYVAAARQGIGCSAERVHPATASGGARRGRYATFRERGTTMELPFRAALTMIACCAACAGPPVVPKESPTAGHAVPATEAASAALAARDPSCASDADCVLNPVDCSECGRCPDDEPSAVMRVKVDALRAECARHAPVRLNPRAAALGLQAPACSPCPGGLGQPRPLWRAVCRRGACGVEPAGTQTPPQGGDLPQPSSAVLE